MILLLARLTVNTLLRPLLPKYCLLEITEALFQRRSMGVAREVGNACSIRVRDGLVVDDGMIKELRK